MSWFTSISSLVTFSQAGRCWLHVLVIVFSLEVFLACGHTESQQPPTPTLCLLPRTHPTHAYTLRRSLATELPLQWDHCFENKTLESKTWKVLQSLLKILIEDRACCEIQNRKWLKACCVLLRVCFVFPLQSEQCSTYIIDKRWSKTGKTRLLIHWYWKLGEKTIFSRNGTHWHAGHARAPVETHSDCVHCLGSAV